MYRISYVLDDSYRVIETISREKANQEYMELCNDPCVIYRFAVEKDFLSQYRVEKILETLPSSPTSIMVKLHL